MNLVVLKANKFEPNLEQNYFKNLQMKILTSSKYSRLTSDSAENSF